MTEFLKTYRYYFIGVGAAIAGLALLNKFAPVFFAESVFPLLVLAVGLAVIYLNQKQRNKQHYQFLNNARGRYPHLHPSQSTLGVSGTSGMFLDENIGGLVLFESNCSGQYAYRDVIRSEVIEDGGSVSSTVRSSQAVGAIVGNIAFGAAGFIVGALTGKNRSRNEVSKVSVAITVNDTQHPSYSVVLLNVTKPILRSSPAAQSAIVASNKLHSLFSVLIRRADDDDKKAIPVLKANFPAIPAPIALAVPPQLPKIDRASFADEFMKLAKLKEQGHLSEQEFVELRAALIAQTKANASSAI